MSTFLPSFRRRRPKIVNPRQAARIPLEIEFLIIDYFEGDTIQLHAFCLVSRDWASYAQGLLFRTVCVRHRNLKSFLAILQTSNNLGPYIITLIVVERTPWLWDENRPSILDTLGPVLADKMRNLRTLKLSYRDLGRYGVKPVPGWASISQLQVHTSRFATAKEMISFFVAFPCLESLDVFQCTTCYYLMQPMRYATPVPAWHLNYLAIGECPQSMLAWLAADPGDLTVDYLRIVSFGSDASSFNALLKKIGRRLRHLELPAPHRRTLRAAVTDSPFSIRDCTALTRLSFSGFDGLGVVSLLSQARAPNLTIVSFVIHFTTDLLDDIRRWGQVDDVLTMDAFANLEKVLLNMRGASFTCGTAVMSFDEATSFMKSRLALLEAKGLLQFTATHVVPQVTVVEHQSSHKPSTRTRISCKLAEWVRRH
ncbi:F-box domain-containing protein [Mycena sanguinolenta]|uniref:F-box domain-containing protein n=1 Tax=Mycena sanguinolenta TaxID=230812 RepID=A0A8H6XLX5_9AGAR|nr:F-box domain-containing protein [Mycena sanguinolenta]